MTDSVNKLVDISCPSEAVVLESRFNVGAGISLRSLVQCGRLEVGQYFVCGFIMGRIRSLKDFRGVPITHANPGSLVEVTGGRKSKIKASIEPPLGDTLFVVSRERVDEITKARFLARRFEHGRINDIDTTPEEEKEIEHEMKNPHLLTPIDEGLSVPLVIKADTAGALDVLRNYLLDIPGINIVSSSIGEITMSDLESCLNANHCPVISYRVTPKATLKAIAQSKQVQIFYDNVLHRLIDMAREQAGLEKPFVNMKPIASDGKRKEYVI